LAPASAFVERNDLLSKFYILMLCLIFVLPNVWAVRTMYYVILLPMFFIVVSKDELWDILRSPVIILAVIYFLVFALAAPFVPGFGLRTFVEHVRNSFMVASFMAMTAYLVHRNREFPFQLFLFLGVVAAIVGINNVWHFYNGLPPLDRLPQRFEGVPGLTMYYNSNWIAQLYGVICVGAAASAARPGARPPAVILLLLSSAALFFCVD
jgi:hypothetical protein